MDNNARHYPQSTKVTPHDNNKDIRSVICRLVDEIKWVDDDRGDASNTNTNPNKDCTQTSMRMHLDVFITNCTYYCFPLAHFDR